MCDGQASLVLTFLRTPNLTLDAKMKRHQKQGLGSIRRQAETLSEDKEDSVWAKGLLGDSIYTKELVKF